MDTERLDPDSCYRAVFARDARFDGLFFTAVKTTRVYCRPVCPARTPRRGSCEFYRTAAGAERAGFRPCLRCRPELAPGRADFSATLAEAILAHLQAGALDAGSSETLARDIGLSSRQVRRILLDHFGVTPIEVAQTQRLLFAKKLLQETELSMTQLAFASGFRSLRRFNAAFAEQYRLAPSRLRLNARGEAVAEPGSRASRPRPSGPARDAEITLRLAYRPPFDWDTMCEFLARRATAGVERVERVDGQAVYRRTVSLATSRGPVAGWLAVSHGGGRERFGRKSHAHVLTVTLSASLLPVLMNATWRLRELFDLDCDPARIAGHLAIDPLLAAAVEAAPGLRMPGAWDRFELALRAVLGQQVSVAGASTLSGRIAARFGTAIVTPFARLDRAAPTPEVLAHADLADIAAAGMPRSRANTVRELARFAANGGLRMPTGTSCDAAVALLDAVSGIGPWTAHYIAMRALRYPDAFPAGDLGLRKALGALEGNDSVPGEATLAQRAEAWRPWRAYAAATLWHSLSRNDVARNTSEPAKGRRT